MRKAGVASLWLGAAVLMAAGCTTPGQSTGTRILEFFGIKKSEPDLRPASQPDDMVLPPTDEPRFSKPMAYPKETLDEDIMPKKKASDAGGFGAGGPGGAGRMGMGGMQQ